MSQSSDLSSTNLFPFPFTFHLVFSLLAMIFFFLMYGKEKKPYQAIFGVAIPISLAVWISDSKTVFYAVGVIELILILAAFVVTLIYNSKEKKSHTASDEDKSDSGAENK